MKKIFTLAAAFMATAVSFQAAADTWTVKDKTEFMSAWGNLGRVQGARDTIIVAPETEGEIIELGNIKNVPTAGKFWIIGATDDINNLPGLKVGFDAEAGTEEGSDLSMHFENISLQYRADITGSGQIFYWNSKNAYMDSVVFRHCEFTNYPRTIYRSVPPFHDEDGDGKYNADKGDYYLEASTINYFEMSDCIIHYANTVSSNKWPAIYFGQVPTEIVIKNNTFYDLPYLKSIFTMNYITDENGRSDATLTFENNTVMVGSAVPHDIISVGNYMGMASVFNINNNILLYPDWTDEYTMAPGTKKPKIIACEYGMVYAANNVIEGYDNWIAGNAKDEESGDYTWLEADTTNNYTMATAELAWDDFYDRTNKDFSLLKEYKVYTLGKDIDGNPTYIGDGRWYLDQFPTKAAVNVSVKGSTTATVTVEPEKAIYFVGDEITLTLDLHDGLNTFTGWSDGSTELTRTVTLTGDLNLTANVVSANYEMIWDFDQLKDGNNKTLTLPLAANHAASAENPGAFGIMTVEHSADKATYADTTSCQTRNNKAYTYNGSKEPVLFMAALLRTRLDSVVVEQEEAAAGYKGELTKACCPNPDYYYIKFSTKGMTGVDVSSVILAEARMHKTTKVEYSLDNKTYNTLTTVTIDSVGDAWRDANVTLPAAAENQDAVYVRWIGDTESPIVGPGMGGTDKDGNGYPVSRKYYTYQFIGNIKVTAKTGGAAIEELEAEATTALVVAQNGDQVTVSNADAATVELYSANGALVASQAVIDGTATVTLPAHGVYYIKAGKDAKAVVY